MTATLTLEIPELQTTRVASTRVTRDQGYSARSSLGDTPIVQLGLADYYAWLLSSRKQVEMTADIELVAVHTGVHVSTRLKAMSLDFLREAIGQVLTTQQPFTKEEQMQLRRISLQEAQRLAMDALLSAERRREEERQREANFWASLAE